MKTLMLALVFLAIPLSLHAHPGKTDRYGGHQCIKDCAEWDLYYREYHLHDKQGRAVRVAQKKRRTVPAGPPSTEPQGAPVTPLPDVEHASVLPVIPPEPDVELVPLNWAVVLLLLLVLLLYRKVRSRRSEQ